MAIAGRRRVPAGFTNVTHRTVGPIASIASQPELTVFRPEQPCLPFLPTRTMTGAGMRSAPPRGQIDGNVHQECSFFSHFCIHRVHHCQQTR